MSSCCEYKAGKKSNLKNIDNFMNIIIKALTYKFGFSTVCKKSYWGCIFFYNYFDITHQYNTIKRLTINYIYINKISF